MSLPVVSLPPLYLKTKIFVEYSKKMEKYIRYQKKLDNSEVDGELYPTMYLLGMNRRTGLLDVSFELRSAYKCGQDYFDQCINMNSITNLAKGVSVVHKLGRIPTAIVRVGHFNLLESINNMDFAPAHFSDKGLAFMSMTCYKVNTIYYERHVHELHNTYMKESGRMWGLVKVVRNSTKIPKGRRIKNGKESKSKDQSLRRQIDVKLASIQY